MDLSSVAVVILNYNGANYLQQFLPSVLSFSENAQVIVADNASTDQSLVVLNKDFPQVRVISLKENFGFCGGYNRALAEVEAHYYVLLNSDVEVTPNWLSPLINILNKDASIACVQPKMKAWHQKDHFEYAGAAGGMLDWLGYPFCRGRLFDVLEKDEGQYNDTVEVFWASGACFVVRAELYHRFGGLEEAFFAHMEEIDLCWRLKNAGYKVMACGESEVFHVGGGTLSAESPRKTYLNFRNNLLLLYKNLPTVRMYATIYIRLFLDGLAGVKFLLSGESAKTLAILKAHFSFYTMLGKVSRKYAGKKEEGLFPSSVVLSFFLKRKKKYSELY